MSSQLKKDTARSNGAKSRGPVTAEGRAKSSANSLRHGLTAKAVLLDNDSGEQFDLLLGEYSDQFQPQTGVEMELVEAMVTARWRLRRLLAIETNLFEIEMVRQREEIAEQFHTLDLNARLGWVFESLASSGNSIALLIRYEGTLNRSYDRAFKQLQVLQAARQSPPLGSFRTPDPSRAAPRVAVPVRRGAAPCAAVPSVPSSPAPCAATSSDNSKNISDTFPRLPPLKPC